MKKVMFFFMALLFVLLVTINSIAEENLLSTPNYRALLIGNTYMGESAEIQRPGNENTVNLMSLVLYRLGYTTTLYLDLEKKEFLDSVGKTFSNSTDNDVSIFYFAGHGGAPLREEYGTYDSTRAVMAPNTLVDDLADNISYAELLDELEKVKGKKIIFLGCCHSGGIFFEMAKRSENDSEKYQDYYVLTASDGNELSASRGVVVIKPKLGLDWGILVSAGYHSHFGAAVLDALDDVYHNDDEPISFQKVAAYTKKTVTSSNVNVFPNPSTNRDVILNQSADAHNQTENDIDGNSENNIMRIPQEIIGRWAMISSPEIPGLNSPAQEEVLAITADGNGYIAHRDVGDESTLERATRLRYEVNGNTLTSYLAHPKGYEVPFHSFQFVISGDEMTCTSTRVEGAPSTIRYRLPAIIVNDEIIGRWGFSDPRSNAIDFFGVPGQIEQVFDFGVDGIGSTGLRILGEETFPYDPMPIRYVFTDNTLKIYTYDSYGNNEKLDLDCKAYIYGNDFLIITEQEILLYNKLP